MAELSAQPLDGDPAARVLVAGASGFTGALAAQIVWRHPRLELVAVTSRSDAGTRLDRLYPRYRVPLELTELDLDALEGVDAAIVAYPHGASAPTVAALRGLGVLVVDLSADFRLRDLPTYERWYGEHGAPELLEGAVYGLTELYREELREAELVATPGCYPTASVLALAPAGRARPARRRRDRRQAGRLRRRPGRRRRDALRRDGRERLRLQDRGPPPPARDRAGAGGAGQPGAGHLRPAPAAARPGRADQLLRADDRADLQGGGPGALPGALRGRALRPRRRRPARACATCATPTSATSTSRSRSGAGCSPSRRSTTSGRAPPARRSRTST